MTAAQARPDRAPENLDPDLRAGRLDLALASIRHWQPLLHPDRGADLALIGPGMTGGPFGPGIGVGIRPGQTELFELFNRASADAGANGTIARLPQARFGFDASS